MFRIGIKAPLAALPFYLSRSWAEWEEAAGRGCRGCFPLARDGPHYTPASRRASPANRTQLTRLCAVTPGDPPLPSLLQMAPEKSGAGWLKAALEVQRAHLRCLAFTVSTIAALVAFAGVRLCFPKGT